MNTIREVEQINEQELERGIAGTPASWHSQYRNSPWVYVGNLDHQLTEGDVLCVMSQFGEIEDINLAREEDIGKSRGFAFVKYEDARSCILSVDNMCGIKLCGRSLRVDHMEKYRLPKKLLEQEEAKEAKHFGAGHAYTDAELANQYSIQQGQDLFAAPDTSKEDKMERKGLKVEKKQRREEGKKERRRKQEGRRIEKEEERKKHRAQRYHEDDSIDKDEEEDSSRDDRKDERRRHRKRNHRRQDSEDESSEDDRNRRRKSHKRRYRDRHGDDDSRHDRREQK